jgi:hypothetical protein
MSVTTTTVKVDYRYLSNKTKAQLIDIALLFANASASALDLAEMGWVIIANASNGDWDKQTDEWKEAARKYADDYHRMIGEARTGISKAKGLPGVTE